MKQQKDFQDALKQHLFCEVQRVRGGSKIPSGYQELDPEGGFQGGDPAETEPMPEPEISKGVQQAVPEGDVALTKWLKRKIYKILDDLPFRQLNSLYQSLRSRN
jgi:hypothetical protein